MRERMIDRVWQGRPAVWLLGFIAMMGPIARAESPADGAAPTPANQAPAATDRARAIGDLRGFRLGCTLDADRVAALELLDLPPADWDRRLIEAYRFEVLAAAYKLFGLPPGPAPGLSELQVYLAGTDSLQGLDQGLPPPKTDVDGLRGARIIYRRVVTVAGDDGPAPRAIYAVIPYSLLPRARLGPDAREPKVVPIPPPDNLRVRCEVDDGAFICLPFDYQQGLLRIHEHYPSNGQACPFGSHGRSLACGLNRGPAAGKGPLRADSAISSVHVCSSCHLDEPAMTAIECFGKPRTAMEGFLKFPELARAELGADAADLAALRRQLADPKLTFLPPDLPRAIEAAWLEVYPEFCKLRQAGAAGGSRK